MVPIVIVMAVPIVMVPMATTSMVVVYRHEKTP